MNIYFKECHEPDSITSHSWCLTFRVLFLCIFIIFDIVVNATSEFEPFLNYSSDQIHKTHILLSSLQILSQLTSCSIVLSLFFDTFPFQIGLANMLLKQFTLVFVLRPVYIVLTLTICGERLVSHEFDFLK